VAPRQSSQAWLDMTCPEENVLRPLPGLATASWTTADLAYWISSMLQLDVPGLLARSAAR